jgi:NADH:ubiquinone oxidoreductase subunit F (NADH-binding)
MRLLGTDCEPTGLARHLELHGPVPHRASPGRLISEVKAAGLTGRGGAAFPAAAKMAAVAARSARHGGGRAIVVANAAEGEPASHKDKQLLRLSPHLVLDGVQLAALAVGARRAYLYVGGPGERVTQRIAERSAAGLDPVAVQVVTAPPRFLAGQESALASKVSGGPALPAFTPPRVFERGVDGAPTLVQNVETLAHMALIARYGASWFRRAGTPAEPGTMLATCHRADGSVVVDEVEIGAPLGSVLRLGALPVQAVLTGGYHGTWIGAELAARLRLANADLRAAGGVLGAGVLAALPAGRCGLAETARVVRYLTAESARQCGPCLAGLPRIADALDQLARPRPDPRLIGQLKRWAGLVEGRGACRHPDGTVRFVRSALTVFAAEIARHRSGTCTARERLPFLPIPDARAWPADVPARRADWS